MPSLTREKGSRPWPTRPTPSTRPPFASLPHTVLFPFAWQGPPPLSWPPSLQPSCKSRPGTDGLAQPSSSCSSIFWATLSGASVLAGDSAGSLGRVFRCRAPLLCTAESRTRTALLSRAGTGLRCGSAGRSAFPQPSSWPTCCCPGQGAGSRPGLGDRTATPAP